MPPEDTCWRRMDKNNLMCLTDSSGPRLSWIVRIIHGDIHRFTHHSRLHDVRVPGTKAAKFVCYLVAENPSEYVQALVRHSFRDNGFVPSQKEMFQDGSVWRISKVAFYTGASAQACFNGAPN